MKLAIACLLLLCTSLASADEFVSICQRSQVMQAFFSITYGFPCEQITQNEIGSVQNIVIDRNSFDFEILNGSRLERADFKKGDFSGMPNLKNIKIENFKNVTWEPGVFEELDGVVALGFDRVGIPALHRNMFLQFPNLKTLLFNECAIQTVEPGAFNGLSRLEKLTFRGSAVEELHNGVFADLPELEIIDLSFNSKLDFIADYSFESLPKIRLVRTGFPIEPRSIDPLKRTTKAAFRGVPEVEGLPADFDRNSGENWGSD